MLTEERNVFGLFDLLLWIWKLTSFFVFLLFEFLNLFCKITLTVTIHHRLVFVLTILFGDSILVDFPVQNKKDFHTHRKKELRY